MPDLRQLVEHPHPEERVKTESRSSHSNAIGMFAGIDHVGLPEMFQRHLYALQYHCSSRPPIAPVKPPPKIEQRQDRALDAHRRVDAVHRERPVAIELGVAGVADLAGRFDQLTGGVVLGEQPYSSPSPGRVSVRASSCAMST